MDKPFRFLVFSTECHKFVIHSEFSLSILDKIELRDFSRIGERYFELVDNPSMNLDLKFRLLGSLWFEVSKKVALYFFNLIKEKTTEDFMISQRMSLYLAANDIDVITYFGEIEQQIYGQSL